MPLESRFTHSPAAPVTDDVRDEIGSLLNQAYAQGAVDDVDYQHLLDSVYAAKTNADLVPVTRALPPALAATQPALGGDNYGPPGELAPLNTAVEARAAAGRMMAQQGRVLLVGAIGVVVVLVILAFILL